MTPLKYLLSLCLQTSLKQRSIESFSFVALKELQGGDTLHNCVVTGEGCQVLVRAGHCRGLTILHFTLIFGLLSCFVSFCKFNILSSFLFLTLKVIRHETLVVVNFSAQDA